MCGADTSTRLARRNPWRAAPLPEYDEIIDEPTQQPDPDEGAAAVSASPDAAPAEPAVEPADEAEAEEPVAEPATGSAPDESLADAALAEGVVGGLTWIPFAVYLGGWIALAGASAYLLADATPQEPARWMPEYPSLVATGLALAVSGPIISLATWLVARTRRPAERRRGLLASALTRGALAAFFGALIWIVTLYLLEVLAGSGAW